MSASWYDVLGVDPDASSEEIRAAWKASIDDLDPGDRRFRLYNSAAEVLLDADARADYDRELTAQSDPEPEPEATPEPAGDGEEAEPGDDSDPQDEADPATDRGGGGAVAAGGAATARARRTVPTWLLAGVAVLVVLVAGAALKFQLEASAEADLADSIREARAAAEESMPLVFSYDYRHPEQDHDRATRVLTGEQLEEYERLWKEGIEPNLEASKGVVSSETVRSGVVNSDDDGERVEVLVVLSTNQANATQQTELTIPMTVTMVEEDGTWLISRVCSGGTCGGDADSGQTPQPSPSNR